MAWRLESHLPLPSTKHDHLQRIPRRLLLPSPTSQPAAALGGFLSASTPPLPINPGMLRRSWAAPLPTCNAVSCNSFSPSGISTSKPNLAPVTGNPPCRVRFHIHTCTPGERSCNLSSASKKWRPHATDRSQVTALLEDEEKKTWDECKEMLSTFNFTLEEAHLMLGKAFGWSHSPYWSEERKKEVPRKESVSEVLDYLKGLGLSDDDLHKLLKKFPEVLGCALDDGVRANVGTLEKEWGIKGKSLRNLLLRNPKVLGYNIDCKGDCMAQCTRCWVRF